MDQRLHYVSSFDATTGHAGEFQHAMTIPQSHDMMTLLRAQVPKSYYTVTSTTGLFYVCADTAGTNDVAIQLQPGNYSATQLAAAITTASGGALAAYFQTNGTGPTRDSKMYFSPAGGRTFLKFLNARLPRLLGFPVRDVQFPSYYQVGAGPYAAAPNCVNVTVTNVLWFCTDAVRDYNFGGFGNCLENFYTNDYPDQSYVTYANPAPLESAKEMVAFAPVKRKGDSESPSVTVLVRFSVLDDTGAILNFNGLDVELTILTFQHKSLFDLVQAYADVRLTIERERRLQLATVRSGAPKTT